MVENDFRSTAKQVLLSTRPKTFDTILLDLIDERLGVLSLSGTWITNSNELQKGWRGRTEETVDFGTDKHFALWTESAQKVSDALSPHASKTFVIAAKFAQNYRLQDGSLGKLPLFRGVEASTWNQRYERYYEALDGLGFQLVPHEPDNVLADEKHMWGPTPFHYVDAAYYQFGRDIRMRLASGKSLEN